MGKRTQKGYRASPRSDSVKNPEECEWPCSLYSDSIVGPIPRKLMLPSDGQAKAHGTLTLKLPIEEDTRDRLSKLQSRGKDMEEA